jgi:hypothetical protein
LRVLNIGYTTAAALDGYQTVWCSARETCREANPLLRPIVERRGVVAAMTVKTGLQAGISAWLWKTSEAHPKRNFWLSLGLFSAQLYVDARNYRSIQAQR